jgi:hypothetical protein
MVRRDLRERLNRLERQIPRPADQTEREGWTESLLLRHCKTWAVRGELEEIPEAIRDAKMWACAEEYGPVFLGLVWEGILEGREEFLAGGVDFTLAEECSDIVGGRLHPPPRSESQRSPQRGPSSL